MLPTLSLRCIILGSSRWSDPGFCVNSRTAADLRYSSSIFWRRLFRRNKNEPTLIAMAPRTPITAPAATAAVLILLLGELVAEGLAEEVWSAPLVAVVVAGGEEVVVAEVEEVVALPDYGVNFIYTVAHAQ